MPVEIKICGLKTVSAVDAACTAGADLLGFVFFPKSPRNVKLAEARDLALRAGGQAKIVALVVDADDAQIEAIAKTLRPDLLQLHGHETPDRCRAIRQKHGIAVMKAIGISAKSDVSQISAYRGAAERILLDAKPPAASTLPGGNGLTFDWSVIEGLGHTLPFMLSGGLTHANVGKAIGITAASAVDVSSGVETEPGTKSPDLIRAFIEAVRSAR